MYSSETGKKNQSVQAAQRLAIAVPLLLAFMYQE
jgi:hypothetical protein